MPKWITLCITEKLEYLKIIYSSLHDVALWNEPIKFVYFCMILELVRFPDCSLASGMTLDYAIRVMKTLEIEINV